MSWWSVERVRHLTLWQTGLPTSPTLPVTLHAVSILPSTLEVHAWRRIVKFPASIIYMAVEMTRASCDVLTVRQCKTTWSKQLKFPSKKHPQISFKKTPHNNCVASMFYWIISIWSLPRPQWGQFMDQGSVRHREHWCNVRNQVASLYTEACMDSVWTLQLVWHRCMQYWGMVTKHPLISTCWPLPLSSSFFWIHLLW